VEKVFANMEKDERSAEIAMVLQFVFTGIANTSATDVRNHVFTHRKYGNVLSVTYHFFHHCHLHHHPPSRLTMTMKIWEIFYNFLMI
jgi:hypothetical protein